MFRQPFQRYQIANPWTELEKLQQEMNRLFEGSFANRQTQAAANFPAMNVWTNEEGVVLTAELPGVEPADIDISVMGDSLTISGNRKLSEAAQEADYHRRERRFGQFSRTFQLPFTVEADKVDAKFQKGVLQIHLPRAEAEKPKKVTVKAA